MSEQIIHYPVLPLIAQRWSPRSFVPDPIPEDLVNSLFEAARWTPSSYNAQPWRYLYAHHEDDAAFQALIQCLNPTNQIWAQHAGLLIACIAETSNPDRPHLNRHAYYDLGAANFALTLQALEFGIYVRQMGGFNQDHARSLLQLPPHQDPVVFLAAGYPQELNDQPPVKVRKSQKHWAMAFKADGTR